MILFPYPNEGESLHKSTFIPALCTHLSFHHTFEKVDKTHVLILLPQCIINCKTSKMFIFTNRKYKDEHVVCSFCKYLMPFPTNSVVMVSESTQHSDQIRHDLAKWAREQ